MMRLQGHLKLGSITEPPGQVLELPDVEDRLSLVIILPSKDVSLGQVNHSVFAATDTRKGSMLENYTCRKLEIPNNCLCLMQCCMLTHVLLSVIPWTLAHQAPLSVGFSRLEYWSRLPWPPPGDLPNLGIEYGSLVSPALAGGFSTTVLPRKPPYYAWS